MNLSTEIDSLQTDTSTVMFYKKTVELCHGNVTSSISCYNTYTGVPKIVVQRKGDDSGVQSELLCPICVIKFAKEKIAVHTNNTYIFETNHYGSWSLDKKLQH